LPGYNPAEAARLMDRAGYPVVDGIRRYKDGQTPLRLTIVTSNATDPAIIHRMQQDYLRNLQIQVTVGHGLFTSGAATTGTFDISYFANTGSPDPRFNIQTLLGSTDAADIPSAQNPGALNFLGILDPWVVQQEQLGEETPDAAQSASVYRDLQRHVAQQLYEEPVFIVADVTLARPTLCNFKKSLAGIIDENTWNMADWFVAPSCP
jgi:ABC-type transport system substrate-binding protein